MVKHFEHIINRLIKLYLSPIKYARHIGVKVGYNTLIADKGHWPSEAYLISIGNNCAITEGVKIHTHGGGGDYYGPLFPILIPSAKCR